MKKIKMKTIKNWGEPSEEITVYQVSQNIGINAQTWLGRGHWAVCHIPTGAAIRPDLPRSKALAIARTLARQDSMWDFNTKDGFAERRLALRVLVRAAVAQVSA